jgi:hypothetical protein
MIENGRIYRPFLVKDVIYPRPYCRAIKLANHQINIFSVLLFVDHTIGFSAAIFSFDSLARVYRPQLIEAGFPRAKILS